MRQGLELPYNIQFHPISIQYYDKCALHVIALTPGGLLIGAQTIVAICLPVEV
jgi:hypothetical protein